jgi:hypothetical protein
MDKDMKAAPTRGLILALVLAVALLAGLFLYQREQQRQEEYQTSLGVARVLSATFEKQTKLNVGEVKGALDITTVDPGWCASCDRRRR